MKRFITVLFVLVMCVNSYSEGFGVKLGFLQGQTLESDNYDDSVDLDDGVNLELGYDFKVTKHLDLGLGYEVISSELSVEDDSLEASMHPFYGKVKWNFLRDKKVNPYIFCKMGYNSIQSDDENLDGGGYFGLGGGVEIGKFLIELTSDAGVMDYSYSGYDGYSYEEYTDTFTASRLSLIFGFNFGRGYGKEKERVRVRKADLNLEKDSVSGVTENNSKMDLKAKLLELKDLRDSGLITDAEYNEKRKEILEKY